MFDAAMLVSDAMREVDQRDGQHLTAGNVRFNASFILGNQTAGGPPRLFRLYTQGNFIEASLETPYFQTGETKYGKPIIDRVTTRSTFLNGAAKCVLVSFDATMFSNLSVGTPIDLICYQRDGLEVRMRRRFDARNNIPRIGRVLIARGRDAVDFTISSTFGPNTLVSFKVWTNEVNEGKTGTAFS